MQRTEGAIERLLHASVRLNHQLGGDTHLPVGSQDSQRRDVAMFPGRASILCDLFAHLPTRTILEELRVGLF